MYHFDWIRRHAERTPQKVALVDAHSGRQFTDAQFDCGEALVLVSDVNG